MTRSRKRWFFLLALLYDFVYDYDKGPPLICALIVLGVLELIQAWLRTKFPLCPMLIFVLVSSGILSEWGIKKHYPVRYVRAIRLTKCQKRWGMGLSMLLGIFLAVFAGMSAMVFRWTMYS